MKQRVCMLGICGAGMAPLAIYLSMRGYSVYGWDDVVNLKIKDLLINNKVIFLPSKIIPPYCDIVVRSSAINVDNDVICQEAIKNDIPILRRGEFLARVCSDRKLLAVVGSHGKTSVTANCIDILKANGYTFDYVLGGFFQSNKISPSMYNVDSEWLVAEIDESDGTMENFSPECTIALNYDDDHIVNYGGHDRLVNAFRDLFARTKSNVIVPSEDRVFTTLGKKFIEKFVSIENLPVQDFTLRNQEIAKFALETIFQQSFVMPEQFCGVQRRNDILLKDDKCIFIHDYAHHPTELEALLRFVRSRYCGYDINIIFQPHRLSRTKQYFKEFASILDGFDRVAVVELYTAFEDKIEGVSSDLVYQCLQHDDKCMIALRDFDQQIQAFYEKILKNDHKQVVLFVGAGNILKHATRYVSNLAFNIADNILKKYSINSEKNKDIAKYFSIRIKSTAKLFVEPKSIDELKRVLNICKNLNLKYVVLGNGTKLLPPDDIINCVVVHLNGAVWNDVEWKSDNVVRCGAGVRIQEFCRCVSDMGYIGIEKLAYIPCCIGGAIIMNAGSHEQAISDKLVSIETLDMDGNFHVIERSALRFGYRKSVFPAGHVIIGATFAFDEKMPESYFKNVSQELLKWRILHQPKVGSFGSVFKNGEDYCAGALIDRCGLKGFSVGGAKISDQHANFIINHNNASSKDVESLIDLARYEVFNVFGKFLNTEINLLR